MPNYMLIMINDREISEAESAPVFARMGRFAGEQAQAGKLQGGAPLKGIEAGARVRVRRGKPQITDGPFAETKEVIGGYFLIDAADRAEAIRIAQQCPHAELGIVEVREIVEIGDMDGPPR
jgi:hypothetical protein